MPAQVATLIDHQIENKDTFERVTLGVKGNNPKDRHLALAGLYFFMVLDRLVHLAEWLSHDVFERPDKYSDLNQTEIELLAQLRAKSGSDLSFPSREQREQIYIPIFGSTENSSANFPSSRDRLMQAAASFANRQANEAVDALIRGFRTAFKPFREFLIRKDGAPVRFSRDQVLSKLTEEKAYKILRSDKVAAAWGYSMEPTANWPYTGESSASELVDAMFEYFSARMQPDGAGTPAPTQGIAELQEIALRGAEAIATCIDVDPNTSNEDQMKVLIAKVYAWQVAFSPQTQPA